MQSISGKTYKKLICNMGLLTIGNFASKLLNYFLIPLYTNSLTTEQFGIADLVTTTIALLVPLFSIQMSEAVMRFLLDKEDTDTVLGSSFRVIIIGLGIATLLSPIMLMFQEMADYYWLFLLLLYSDIFYTYISQFIKGIEKVMVFSVAGIINTFVVASTNIIFLTFLKTGVKGYLLSFIIGYIVSILYMIFAARKTVHPGWFRCVDLQMIKKMGIYALPLIPNAMCWWVNSSSDKYFITAFCGAAAVGIYAVAYKIPSLLSTLLNIFFGAWQISAVEDFGSEASKSFFSDIFKKTLLLNVLASIVLIGSAKYLGKVLFAKDFYIAWKYTILLIMAYFFSTLASFLGSVYTSAKQTKMLFITSVLSAAINFLLNWILIPYIGLTGAAIATISCYFIVFIVRLIHSRKYLKMKINVFSIIMSVTIVLVLGLLTYLDIRCVVVGNMLITIIYAILLMQSLKTTIGTYKKS